MHALYHNDGVLECLKIDLENVLINLLEHAHSQLGTCEPVLPDFRAELDSWAVGYDKTAAL